MIFYCEQNQTHSRWKIIIYFWKDEDKSIPLTRIYIFFPCECSIFRPYIEFIVQMHCTIRAKNCQIHTIAIILPVPLEHIWPEERATKIRKIIKLATKVTQVDIKLRHKHFRLHTWSSANTHFISPQLVNRVIKTNRIEILICDFFSMILFGIFHNKSSNNPHFQKN